MRSSVGRDRRRQLNDPSKRDPRLVRSDSPSRPRAIVLLLHGGREFGKMRVGRLNPAVLRIDLLHLGIRRELDDAGIAIYRLRFTIQGWNGDGSAAIADARSALDAIAHREQGPDGEVPRSVVVGHSMGGRAAAQVADHPNVEGVVGLAPWLPEGEPVIGFAGKRLLVAHGSRDRTTSPRFSKEFVDRATAAGADASWTSVPGEGHALLRYPRRWNRFVLDAVIRPAHA